MPQIQFQSRMLFICLAFPFITPKCAAQDLAGNTTGRHVINNTLVSSSTPDRLFEVSKTLLFLADTAFVLSDRSNVEVFFFADTREGLINRFLQFQFETLKSDAEGGYHYDFHDSLNLGGVLYGRGYWCFDLIEAMEERPTSDIAVVQHMLRKVGSLTEGHYTGTRYVYLSEDKRAEMLIIYGENVALKNVDCANEETGLPLLMQIEAEALEVFNVQEAPDRN